VIGSRSGGPKLPRLDSDWDYVIEANSYTRRSAGKSLPGAKDINEGSSANQDIFKTFKEPNQPRITFYPEG
jgi:hypothetical protein